MGLLRSWFNEMGDMASRMSHGDPTSDLGLPGTGHGGTGPGSRGTGSSSTGGAPGGSPRPTLTSHQRQVLMQIFHRDYGRFPQSEYEFQQWLANW